MIPMLSCLFCKRKRRLFKIYKIYGRTERPITSYIISFFGDVEEFLKEDHGICSACVFLLNKLIYIKNFMLKTIVEGSTNDDTCVSFSNAYKLFLHNLDKLNFDDAELPEEETVSDLLKPTHSIPCHSYSETDYDYSSGRNTPYVDQEVEKVFRKGRRKRRRRTEIDEDRVSTPLLRYDKDGRLLNKRTRSVSRILNTMQEELDSEHKDEFCRYVDCQRKNDRGSAAQENISHHESLAKYWCYECRSGRFTSLDDFVHHKAPEMTTFCRIDYNSLPQNPSADALENATGDFSVKVLVQTEKLSDSPHLQFNQSPDVTSSEGTDPDHASANSVQVDSVTDEATSYGWNDADNRSTTSSTVTSRFFTPSTGAEFEDVNSVDERISIGEKEDKGKDESESDELEFVPSAFETERIIHDVIESSFESEDSSSSDDVYLPPMKELKVVLERLVLDSNQLSSLKPRKKPLRNPATKKRTKQTSNRSQSTNYLEFKGAKKDLFPRRSLSPRKLSNSPSAVSVPSFLRSTGTSTSKSEVISVRTDTETDTNDSNC